MIKHLKSFYSGSDRYKSVYILISVCLFIILLSYTIRIYFINRIDAEWDMISAEKIQSIEKECADLFYSNQNELKDFTDRILKNRKLVNFFVNQNLRKLYETFFEVEGSENYNTELYNARLELVMFNGRQIQPSVYNLRRAYKGEIFTIVRVDGMFSYLDLFAPVLTDEGNTCGILVVSRLLDVNNALQTKFFENVGLRNEIYRKYHIDAGFEFYGYSNLTEQDTTSANYSRILLKGINNEILGTLVLSKLDKQSYINSVKNLFDKIIAFILFIITALIIYSSFIFSQRSNIYLKLLLPPVSIIISRYIWILLEFPERFLNEIETAIFSVGYYASGFGFGIAKSPSELLITTICVLTISIYYFTLLMKLYQPEKVYLPLWVSISLSVLISIISLMFIHTYGIVLQNLISDSTINYLEKSAILSFSQSGEVVMNLIILFVSVSLILLLSQSILLNDLFLRSHFRKLKYLRRYLIVLISCVMILVNYLFDFVQSNKAGFFLNPNQTVLIIVVSGLFTYFIQTQALYFRYRRFINVKNISLLMLSCTVFVPYLMINKISSQENRYLEKAAKELAFQSGEKISFMVSMSLEDALTKPELYSDITHPDKAGKLAFNIWTGSKLYEDNLNSAVIILDSKGKVISDFNLNTSLLNTDSVVNFSMRYYNIIRNITDYEPDTYSYENKADGIDMSSVKEFYESVALLQNKDMKYYSAIAPVKNSDYNFNDSMNLLGYMIIAASYDSQNFFSQSNTSIFRNFMKGDILRKFTTPPIISEFSDGELVSSTSRDISRSFAKSLDAFRESVKNQVDKSALRYDEFENQLYKSFYVLTQSKLDDLTNTEKIFVVSIRLNNFATITFFYFKFLIFVVLVYLVIIVFYILNRAIALVSHHDYGQIIKIGFREKIFISFLIALLIPMIILAVYTREFVKNKNEEFYRNSILSDLKIAEKFIADKLQHTRFNTSTGMKYKGIFSDNFTGTDKNFNYYVKTNLAATTNEELFKSYLLDTRLSSKAYYNIILLKKDFFQETQQIGNLTYIVGYKPVYDLNKGITGIISSQTIFRQSEINSELTESLVYILGPYFTAVILLIFIVNYLSYRISNPIIKLQKATEQVSRGNVDVSVKSSTRDEIGELVKSFNNMIKELKRSRIELKKAERESAWRDIARQVAHEIKNPLTPIKLAIQYLYSSYKNGSGNFVETLEKTNRLIIDQIETLNKIATEFSDFAKLPQRNYEKLDINQIIKDVVNLLNTDQKIQINLSDEISEYRVKGDKDEVMRVFINIIKNSLQAISDEDRTRSDGIVEITSSKINNFIKVVIKDNGVGMEENVLKNLFEPYFSTKSTGMGLGLVITKKILDDMKAEIHVDSVYSEGTVIEINFPVSAG